MTRMATEPAPRSGFGPLRRPLTWCLLAAAAASGHAFGEVRLETGVSKVETTLDGAGRVKRELVPADEVVPGEELRYTIRFENTSDMVVDADRVVITNPVPDGTVYVAGSAGGDGSRVEYSTDGETFTGVEPGGAPPSGSPGTQGTPAAGAGPDAVRSLRWTYQRALEPGESGEVYFHVRMK